MKPHACCLLMHCSVVLILWSSSSMAQIPDSGRNPIVEPHRVIRTLAGSKVDESFGFKIRNIGDIDNDDIDDIAIAVTGRDNGALQQAGAIDVISSASGKLMHSYPGHHANGYFGNGIGAAGDVNGDGTPDVVAGSFDRSDTLVGYAAVFSGQNGLTHHILRSGRSADEFGQQTHGAGDLDKDGYDDIIVGAPGDDTAGDSAGRAYVFSGRTGAIMFTLEGESAGDQFGSSVTGDVYGNSGIFAVGALDAGPDGRGMVYVYRMQESRPVIAFTIDPVESSRELGAYFLSVVGDVDADGTQDIYAADYADNKYGPESSRVFIHSGHSGKRLLELEGHNTRGGFGTGYGRVGDIDGDGHDDVAVGSWNNSEQGQSAGKCQLFSGMTGASLATFTGNTAGQTFGHDVIGVGDVNNDGAPDILITNAGNSSQLPRAIGHVYFFAGPWK